MDDFFKFSLKITSLKTLRLTELGHIGIYLLSKSIYTPTHFFPQKHNLKGKKWKKTADSPLNHNKPLNSKE